MPAYEGFANLETRGWSDDGISSGYVSLFAVASDMAIAPIIESIKDTRRVLDLCCGQGNVTEALHRAGHAVVGADFSDKMLDHARQRLPRGEFLRADAQDLPFEDAEFDTVVCSFGLMHVPDQPKALAQIHRVLRPAGQFLMTSWCGPDASPVFKAFYSSVQEHGHASVAMPDSPNFHQYADPDMAQTILSEAGFSVEKQRLIDCHWMLDSPEGLAEIFETGAPRGGYLLSQQPEANRAAIKAAVAQKVRNNFAEGDQWRAPQFNTLTAGSNKKNQIKTVFCSSNPDTPANPASCAFSGCRDPVTVTGGDRGRDIAGLPITLSVIKGSQKH